MFVRLRAAAVAACLMLCLIPAAAAAPAEVLIHAGDMDFPQRRLTVEVYQREGYGVEGFSSHTVVAPVNRVTGDVELQIQPEAGGATVSVDYLTDLNGDGVWELIAGGDAPVCDTLTQAGTLASQSGLRGEVLPAGRTYLLSGRTLEERGRAALLQRTDPDSELYLGLGSGAGLLYMVTITSGSDPEQSQCYYLQIFDAIPAPTAGDYVDVAPGTWYYDAVEYVVSREIMGGVDFETFEPDGVLTRSMLAQILYNFSGSPETQVVTYGDVSVVDWYVSAVSWAKEKGLMTGYSQEWFGAEEALTREELAVILMKYAALGGLEPEGREALLSSYADAGQVSSWAREAVSWAVEEGLLSGDGQGQLEPLGTVTRAQFATVMRAFCRDVIQVD